LIRRRFGSGISAITGRLSRTVDKNGSLVSLIRSRWIEILYVFGIVTMASGIVNAAIQPVDSRYIIFPGQGSQSITETIINALALMLGATGIYLSYLSGRQTTKPRMVTFYLILGLLLLGTGIYIGIYVYSSK
jgi:hypothetical protein